MEKSWKIVRASYEDLPEIMEILKGACGMVKTGWSMWRMWKRMKTSAPACGRERFILKAEAKDEIAGFLMVRFPGEEADNLGSHLGLPREAMGRWPIWRRRRCGPSIAAGDPEESYAPGRRTVKRHFLPLSYGDRPSGQYLQCE